MEEKREQIEKIVVKSSDELIDVVREISNTKANKIVVSFVEDSDILISSINLKVLLDSADEKEALLVLQIPANPSGIRNAKLAGIPVVETPGLPSDDVWKEAQEEYIKRLKKISESSKSELPKDYKSENITSFEDKVNSVLDKSKTERSKIKEEEENSDLGFVVDSDIGEEKSKGEEKGDLTKVDLKDIPKSNKKKSFDFSAKFDALMDFFRSIGSKKSSKPEKIKAKEPKQREDKDVKSKFVKLLPKIIIPIVVVVILFFLLYFRLAPYVRVTIFIESKPVEVEKTFTGNENINEIDFENLEIPIKKETVTKSVSDTVEATGTAYRGKKATGSVTVQYIYPDGCPEGEETISLSPGQQITTKDGSKTYVLTGNITITCNSYSVVGVEAVEVGEEYNIPSGNWFSVNGYDSSKVFATNTTDAFTGGSKEEYTVLSQQDVNGKVEELTKLAKEEAESSLKDVGNGWEIIESTIESKVKEGSIKSAVAIGTETNSSDVSLEVESSATYYYTQGVDEGLNDLLTEAAKNQNLFESEEGLDLTLTGDIEKELSVNEEGGEIKITLTAASSVEPSVDKDKIISDLHGMRWEEGVEYIKGLSFTADKAPIINFEPEHFPDAFRYFPSRQGRINLVVEEYTVEE
ncbi:MAG: seg [candidate division WS6 bacterium 34_10]|uniref:Seg n=1 Tax=candidate division WS6 bacterium 34_10 TaxID=1641389 RepID=A0A101HIS8_9BACT|nr:MAG: seg [candidate division WS6 bacterium 34_10]